MRIYAVFAVFDHPAVLFGHHILSRTVIKMIERAVAEQAVDIVVVFVTRVKPAVPVGKKSC